MGHRLPMIAELYKRLPCHFFILSYRGYGKSQGSPSEKGLKMDADAAFKFIQNHAELKSTKIVVLGQSIGGAVAIHITQKYSNLIHGLILENTFLSLVSFQLSFIASLASLFKSMVQISFFSLERHLGFQKSFCEYYKSSYFVFDWNER
jgi:fermentation-respiration switch protein FrsA (DUF1100 family)